MDLSQLSNEDLIALRAGDLSKVSNEGLMSLRGIQGPKNNDLASQAGLAVRAGIKGVSALPAMLADAVTGPLNFLQDKVLGQGQGYRFQAQMPLLDKQLTAAGLPTPDTPTQRIVSQGVELGTGSGLTARAADYASRATEGVTQKVLQTLGANIPTQVSAGAGAGLAGQQSAENGGGWGAQFVSSLLGGLAGAGGAAGVKSAASKAEQLFSPAFKPVEVEKRITIALQNQGIDPASITPAMMTALKNDVTQALKINQGSLDEAALARLADYRRLGMSPTVGRVTLDPVAVTQEQNAMKVAASMGARDAQLPQIAAANNRTLLNSVEALNPINDRVGVGSSLITPIRLQDVQRKSNIDALYSAARDSSGRSLPLEGGTFTRMANEALDQANVGSFLPPDIAKKMNGIASGQIPLTVDVAEQLKTSLASISRNSNDGNVRTAVNIVRRALDDAPLQNDKLFNPGNVPAIPGSVPPSVAGVGQEALDAFSAARQAARERFSWLDSTPGIKRALEGATAADNFLQNNVLSRTASTADVAKLRGNLDPQAVESAKSGIVDYLKQSAIGRGNSTDTANFSGRQWSAALQNIGEEKLKLFFSPAELEQLKAIGRVGSIETFQPRGSAVNNSNTAAGVASLISGISKYVQPFASKIPLGEAAINAPLGNIQVSLLERGAQQIPRGLLQVAPVSKQVGLLDQMLIPGFMSGGLLASP